MASLIFAMVLTLVPFTIFQIDQLPHGFIPVSQQAKLDLRDSINRAALPAAAG
jgi:hypothetical protein